MTGPNGRTIFMSQLIQPNGFLEACCGLHSHYEGASFHPDNTQVYYLKRLTS